MSFGQRLKLAIKYRGLTQKDVASAMQVTPQNLNQYIRDRRQPSKEFIGKLAEILKLEFRYTLEGDPFFYISPQVSAHSKEMNDFCACQIANALMDSNNEIYFDDSSTQIKVKRYEDMNKVLAFKIQLDLQMLNANGKILVAKCVDELLEDPKYREEDTPTQELTIPRQESTSPEQNNTAPDTLLAAHQRTDTEPTKEGTQHDLDIMNDESKWD